MTLQKVKYLLVITRCTKLDSRASGAHSPVTVEPVTFRSLVQMTLTDIVVKSFLNWRLTGAEEMVQLWGNREKKKR